MKKVGRETLLLSCNENNLRNGEGSFLRLKDGGIVYAYTKYYGGGGEDHDTASIFAVYSYDEGETWSESQEFFAKPDDALNIMSCSLLRMQNGDLGLFYLKKQMVDGEVVCNPVFHRSVDEGKTFSDGIFVCEKSSYYCLINDRVITLKNGRIIMAVANHRKDCDKGITVGVVETHYSDDDGKTFKKSLTDVYSPINDAGGLMEPGLLELPDGKLWLYARTNYGYQYQSFSNDGGLTWSKAEPNYKITSPSAPMLSRNIDKYNLTIFNPMPQSTLFSRYENWIKIKYTRTPFVMAVFEDGGKELTNGDYSSGTGEFLPFIERCYFIEDDFTEAYCYPTLIEVKGGVLVAYYYSNGSGQMLNSARIKKISFAELD